MSYVYRCQVCAGMPVWTLTRIGDAATAWSCNEHLAATGLELQRSWEDTELRLTMYIGPDMAVPTDGVTVEP